MTTAPTPDERVDAFAAELHRLADLIAEGAVPVPFSVGGSLPVSWYVHGADRDERAAGIARALAPEWQASHYASSTHASASATVGGISYEVSIAREVPEPDRTPSEQFAAELTEQAAKAQRQQLEVDTLDRCPIFLGHDDDEGGSNRCAGPIGHKGSHDARSAVWA